MDDVLERVKWFLSPKSPMYRSEGRQIMEALAAEVRELRARLSIFEELCGYMRWPIEVARKSLPLRVAGEPKNVDIFWRTSEETLDLYDAAMAEAKER